MPSHRKRWFVVVFIAIASAMVGFLLWWFWQPQFSGRLVDLTGAPLTNATVSSGSRTTTTDASGLFRLRIPSSQSTLTVQAGEETVTLDLEKNKGYASLAEVDTTAPSASDIEDIFGSGSDTALTDEERVAIEEEIEQGFYPESGTADATPEIVVPVTTTVPENLPPPVDPTTIVTNEEGVDVIQGEILVGWQTSTTAEERSAAVFTAGGELRFDDPESLTSIVYVADQTNVPTVVSQLQKSPLVTGALQNYLLEPEGFAPTDPHYSDKNKRWWLQRLNAEPAWAITKGQGNVVVAVIDVGFELDHPDLVGAFTKTTLNYTTAALSEYARHGTHVSGIIAARQNNGEGLTGIAPQVRILPVKIYDLARLPSVYTQLSKWKGVRIATMSMGMAWGKKNKKRREKGLLPFSAAYMQQQSTALDNIIRPAFDLFYHNGGVMCKSAGNDFGLDAAVNSLNFPEVITVGAGVPAGGLTNFSNVGTKVDIVAPGYKIWSPVSGHTYAYLSGTSMATPTVCGTIALIRSLKPQSSPLLVKTILKKSSTSPSALSAHGYGYLDTWRSLLRTQRRFGVTGLVVDPDFDFVAAASVATQPWAWSVTTDNLGQYVIPSLLRQSYTIEARKGNAKGKETVNAPPVAGDEVIELVIIEVDKEEDENVNNENANANTNNANDNENGNTNADSTDSEGTESTESDGETVLPNGIVVSAEGCAVRGFTAPETIDDCGPGFSFSRETIACEQTTCPEGVGRTYTLECKCSDGRQAIYACEPAGLMVACLDATE